MTDVTGNLSFNDGFQKISINEDMNRVIRWNPNDVSFIDRFLAFQSWVDNDFKPRAKALKTSEDGSVDDYSEGMATALGEELSSAIDGLFRSPVSQAAFDGANPISGTPNGQLLFVNFLNALMPIIEKSVKDFEGARKKYTATAKKVTTGKKSS